jgi:parvulin-like peptidyl-prolyl isomerase
LRQARWWNMKMSIETEFLLDSERKRLLGRWLAGLLAVPAAGALIFFATIAVGKMEDPVIASAGNISIHRSDLEALMSDIDSNTRSRVLNDTQAMSALVRRDLGRRLLQQHALEEMWVERPDVKARIERARVEVVAASYLEAHASPPETFPTEAEVETAYQLNQQRFVTPRQYHLAQVYLRRPKDGSEAAAVRKNASSLFEELRKSPDRFAEAARAKSNDSASAAKGGDLMWVSEDQVQPEIRVVLAGLTTGAVSEPIELADGWHIVRLIETKAAAVTPLTQVHGPLVAMLRQQRTQENAAALVSKLMTEQQAGVDEIALAKVQRDLH